MSPIWKIHFAATLYMTGVIWFVQIVHYPLFDAVRENHGRFANRHQSRTGFVVAPVMLVELFTAVLLMVRAPSTPLVANLVLIAVIWAVTFAVSVPCHQRLLEGFDTAVHRRLVASNWLRTAAWSARALLLLMLWG